MGSPSLIHFVFLRYDPSTAKNPDILTYVCGLEFGTFALSGHSISQMLAKGRHTLAALGEDLQAVSRLMATSFVQMAANLQSSSEQPSRMAGQWSWQSRRYGYI